MHYKIQLIDHGAAGKTWRLRRFEYRNGNPQEPVWVKVRDFSTYRAAQAAYRYATRKDG